MAIDPKRLERFEAARLLHGAHASIDSGGCVMEWAAYLAGKPHTDSPPCVSAPIGSLMRSWNDGLPDEQRQMLKPYAVKVLGTAASRKIEERRSWMAMDWLIREFTPTWLETAGLKDDAASLRGLPELTDGHGVADVMSVLLPAQKHAAAAWDAAGAAAGAAAWDAARAAAGAAAGDALVPTVKRLQDSAFKLLDRMIAASAASEPKAPPTAPNRES